MNIKSILLLCSLCVGCEVIGGAEIENIGSRECGDTWLCTDLNEYIAVYEGGEGAYSRYGFTLIAHYENRLLVPVFIERCGFYSVMRIQGEEPGYSGYNAVSACAGSPGIPIFPGEVKTTTLEITGPNSWQSGRAMGELEGEFQLVYEINRCPEEVGCELEEEYRVSNVFNVRVEK